MEDWDPEADCYEYGGTWNGEWCEYHEWDPESDCYEYGGTWNGEWCEYPEWDPEADCYEYGGTWNGFECEYPEWEPEEPYDDGSLWSATNEADCLDRGGVWDSAWEYCYEEYEEYDDGSIWSATTRRLFRSRWSWPKKMVMDIAMRMMVRAVGSHRGGLFDRGEAGLKKWLWILLRMMVRRGRLALRRIV